MIPLYPSAEPLSGGTDGHSCALERTAVQLDRQILLFNCIMASSFFMALVLLVYDMVHCHPGGIAGTGSAAVTCRWSAGQVKHYHQQRKEVAEKMNGLAYGKTAGERVQLIRTLLIVEKTGPPKDSTVKKNGNA